MSKLKDLTGLKFGRLTVIERTEDYITPSGSHKTRWRCVCECGKECNVTSTNLNQGKTNSCGCLKKDKPKEVNKMFNNYQIINDYVIIYTNNNDEIFVDTDDYLNNEKIRKICWVKSNGYALGRDYENGRLVRLHRLILNTNLDIDHINHNTLDNRKCNLRPVTKSQNAMNKSIKSNNTSGIIGVVWEKNIHKWRARITFNKHTIELGVFENFDDAVKVRKEAEIKYFGEYRYGGVELNG